MSTTKYTKNYELSQFQPDDTPSWEDDYNTDMVQYKW